MRIDRPLLRASWRSWVANDVDPVGPPWLQPAWTLLFCAGVALGFTLLGIVARGGSWREPAAWPPLYAANLVISLAIGVCAHLLYAAVGAWLGKPRLRRLAGWGRTAYTSGIQLLSVALGWPIGLLLASQVIVLDGVSQPPAGLFGMLLVVLLVTGVIFQFFEVRARQIHAERAAAEAHLRLLQGQIEPHFLFNTLANAISLVEQDPPRARQLLEAFSDVLRQSLGGLRRDDSTVGDELALAEAYLHLLRLRMGERLDFRIDADPALHDQPLPALLLQPLVENAITHGLEPMLDGGTVRVHVRREADRLEIEVLDDGAGLPPAGASARSGGHGLALANLRERLAARYGGAAGLALEPAAPGTRARLWLPVG
ncbi:sensor histidine kinase [Piscinibacter sakaiensis]|uniref:Histidine kinase domain-containing protein n=1 Tax=Piscinibacter sakaiensis TaxID=1547922 RepID=A0A0K8P2G7_PISS1|nr:histidine kinase [Piscinibacter sakaiensis]GAP36821.1 hypothetical protein ISF6_2661 [Piscinibacter sakaiensis]